jgi:hypothetical protein
MSHGCGWIGVDLDGTLAHYDKWRGIEHIGDPIPAMAERVKQWIAEDREVKIFTARAHDVAAVVYIKKWLLRHGFGDLEVTATKNFQMVELWDDRAVEVEANTGRLVNPERAEAEQLAGYTVHTKELRVDHKSGLRFQFERADPNSGAFLESNISVEFDNDVKVPDSDVLNKMGTEALKLLSQAMIERMFGKKD